MDGARRLDGKGGASIVIPSIGFVSSYRVADNADIDNIELSAISKAISLAVQLNLYKPVIVTDSLNAINFFESDPSLTSLPQIQTSRELIHKYSTQLSILWVPGHAGLVQHDLADLLAKESTNHTNILETLPPTIEEATNLFRKQQTQKWENSITSLRTGQAYHKSFPLGRPSSLKNLPRRKNTIITRLRLHHNQLNLYLKKIGAHDTGLCDVCKVDESTEHFLLHCTQHADLALRLSEAAAKLKLPCTIKTFLEHEPFLTYIVAYVKEKGIKI